MHLQKKPADEEKASPANETAKDNETGKNESDKGLTGNETAKKNETKHNETKTNDTKAENETRELNETEKKQAEAAWDEWYETRSKAMWEKCTSMPVCVKLCRWIRLAFVVEYGSEDEGFKAADKDGDGKVSSEEFVKAAVKAGVTDEAMSVRGYAILYVIDINEDGFVSKKNFDKLVQLGNAGDRQADKVDQLKEAAKGESEDKAATEHSDEHDASEKTHKTAEEERAAHRAEIEKLMKEVDEHEEELDGEIQNEYKELMKDHPKPTHHPEPTWEKHEEPAKVESEPKIAKLEKEEIWEPEHEHDAVLEKEEPAPPKSYTPRCAKLAGILLTVSFVAA